MITTTPIRKALRVHKFATLEIKPITEADCGIVKNGEATCWVRITGALGGGWAPMLSELHAVKALRRKVKQKEEIYNRRGLQLPGRAAA